MHPHNFGTSCANLTKFKLRIDHEIATNSEKFVRTTP